MAYSWIDKYKPKEEEIRTIPELVVKAIDKRKKSKEEGKK